MTKCYNPPNIFTGTESAHVEVNVEGLTGVFLSSGGFIVSQIDYSIGFLPLSVSVTCASATPCGQTQVVQFGNDRKIFLKAGSCGCNQVHLLEYCV